MNNLKIELIRSDIFYLCSEVISEDDHHAQFDSIHISSTDAYINNNDDMCITIRIKKWYNISYYLTSNKIVDLYLKFYDQQFNKTILLHIKKPNVKNMGSHIQITFNYNVEELKKIFGVCGFTYINHRW